MSRKKKTKKKQQNEFPNDWLLYKKLKPKHFERVSFKDFWEERVSYWELIPQVQLVARVHHLPTGKIREHIFKSAADAKRHFHRLGLSGEPYHVYCFDHSHSFTLYISTDD